jgi:hypothetical protein
MMRMKQSTEMTCPKYEGAFFLSTEEAGALLFSLFFFPSHLLYGEHRLSSFIFSNKLKPFISPLGISFVCL